MATPSRLSQAGRYRAGAHFERKVMELLNRQHDYTCLRSAGSSGVADVWACKPGEMLFIQCKRDGSLSPADWNALHAAAEHAGAVPLMAAQDGRQITFYRLLTPREPRQKPLPWELWEPCSTLIGGPSTSPSSVSP